MPTQTVDEFIYRKNPAYELGNGEPEMLDPEIVTRTIEVPDAPSSASKAELLAKVQELISAIAALPDDELMHIQV